MQRWVVLLVVVALALAGCTRDGEAAGSERSSASTAVVVVTTTTNVTVPVPDPPVPPTAPRAPVPVHDQLCSGEPPFEPGYLPAGFGALRKGDAYDYAEKPEDHDEFGGEPYDPQFHYPGPRGARIDVYHGNSWRLLAFALERELQVMGRAAWLSRHDGSSLIDFPAVSSPGPCDYWALGAEGITEAELLRVAASLVPT